MPPQSRLDKVKKHIAVLIKRGDCVVPHETEYPKKWFTEDVIDPRSGEPFTAAGAWDFIREKCQERGTVIQEIVLNKPPGRMGYVLRERTKDGVIYIKVHFGGAAGQLIVGRSFHYEGKT